jgi:hypothetical protein
MDGQYINDSNNIIPEKTIVLVPFSQEDNFEYSDVLESLSGKMKRDWFNSHFYYCLPLTIGNQYGFIIKSTRTFDMEWDGRFDSPDDIKFTFLDEGDDKDQTVKCGFGSGIVTIQNRFVIRTPPGINIMTIQPPNMFIEGAAAMTGVIESDNLRRDFTFNLKITIPNYKIRVNKGDALGAFIPIERYSQDGYEIRLVSDLFDKEVHENELKDIAEFGRQRSSEDLSKPHQSGKKYFKGEHAFEKKFEDHQRGSL